MIGYVKCFKNNNNDNDNNNSNNNNNNNNNNNSDNNSSFKVTDKKTVTKVQENIEYIKTKHIEIK